jgi:hypothetical protein
MSKPRILIQLDSDAHTSVFDSVVAIDAGIDQLLPYHEVEPTQVRDLVHGAMFTRGPADLKSTAIFIGGANVAAGEKLLEQVTSTFFGPMHVSVMLDANGANTTAVAAVLSAAKHIQLDGATATVLAATGPVGQRVARLLVREGAIVRAVSRDAERAEQACETIRERVDGAQLTPLAASNPHEVRAACDGSQLVISAGAAGIELLRNEDRAALESVDVAIDLNAVPPVGIGGIEVTDAAVERDGMTCYGAIGVGGLKMKIHKAAIRQLFESNDQVLDAEEIYRLGQSLL